MFVFDFDKSYTDGFNFKEKMTNSYQVYYISMEKFFFDCITKLCYYHILTYNFIRVTHL